MKNSVYDELRPPEMSQEVRKTKKKFTLTSTSSTLEKFSEKLNITVGKKPFRLNHVPNVPQIKEKEEHA